MIQLLRRNFRNRNGIPSAPLHERSQPVYLDTAQFLQRGARTLVIASPVANRDRILVHLDFKVIQPTSIEQSHLANDAHRVANLIRNIFTQLMSILNTTNAAVIFDANKERSPFGICEGAHPFQIFILPRLFKFSVLTFFNQNFRSNAASICRMLRLVDVRGVPFTPKSRNKKRRISPLDGETRLALMYLIFRILARGLRKFYRAFPGSVGPCHPSPGRAILASLTAPQRRPSGHYP